MSAAAVLLMSTIILFSFAIASPATSPTKASGDIDGDGVPNDIDAFPSDPSEFRDSDGDGIGDSADVFPHDPSETDDSDSDGIGDNADFFDEGNGGVRISVTRFEFEGYDSSCYRMEYYPDVRFQILVCYDGDACYEYTFCSEVFPSAERLECCFDALVDLSERAQSIRLSILVYDVWNVNNNDMAEVVLMDYMPMDGVRADEQTLSLPCDCTFFNTGEGDLDGPDCSLEYSISTAAI
ncbi:MAG: hypothetical protein JSV90_09325 [Methanobacteriota archaeon]|nr:MAG: hypothetical protein JSV90_09325 [Euryarchaeota archaeon]